MNSLIRGVTAPFRRSLHKASALPFVESHGVGGFLSPKGLGMITSLQTKNIETLNGMVRGT